MWSISILIFLTLCAGAAGWLLFIWAVKSGQYDDVEGPKYRMLDDDDEDEKHSPDPKDKTGS
ncbi:MAG: cbb3-type cytochrome oxidase assembly protein CcoS [Nitrospirota bacterium]